LRACAAFSSASLGPSGAVTRPILPSADFNATAAFYGPLGFEVTGRRSDYLILVGPDRIELRFWLKPDVDRWANHVACWIGYPTVSAVRRRHAAWAAALIAAPAQLCGSGHRRVRSSPERAEITAKRSIRGVEW
jgi:hypothetical protein